MFVCVYVCISVCVCVRNVCVCVCVLTLSALYNVQTRFVVKMCVHARVCQIFVAVGLHEYVERERNSTQLMVARIFCGISQ